jgi:hypothetical protein
VNSGGAAAVVPRDVADRVAIDLADEDVVVGVSRALRVDAVRRGEIVGVDHAVVVEIEGVTDELGALMVLHRRRPRRGVERLGLGITRRVVGQGRLMGQGRVGIGHQVLAHDHLERVDVRDRGLRGRRVRVDAVAGAADVARDHVQRRAGRGRGLELIHGRAAAARAVDEDHGQRQGDDRQEHDADHELDEREPAMGGSA